ncbi:MAG: hypothetical protein PHI69_01065 [Eubacteriales bacterium]|nr:hypothetical protein [Eubacteriales bacterium]
MYFDHKLSGLMKLFKISNSKLARGINVDASLVSRWKSGERTMSVNSPHVPAIASFFLSLSTYHYQKEYLDFILKSQLSPDLLQDEGRRIHALADWLISDEPMSLSPAMEKSQSPAYTQNMIANIAGLMDTDNLPKLDSQTASISRLSSEPGEESVYEKFNGITGRRQAVLNFLIEIVQSDKKQELLLHSEDDMTWLTGDRQFTLIWASLLKQIIESGHSITIIHVVNRQREEIMNALTYWMPLHLAGKIKSYYYPRYADSDIKRTLFISRGRSAVVAFNLIDSNDQPTFIYRDQETVAMYESLYEAHLKNCQPLFSVFGKHNEIQLLETGLELRRKSGTVFNIRSQLNSLLLPGSLLQDVSDRGNNFRAHDMSRLLLHHQQVFHEKLKEEPYIDIVPLSLLDQIENIGQAEVDSCLLCLSEPWVMTISDTINWLNNTVETLKNYEHYHLLLSDQTPGLEDIDVNIVYKENNGALFSPSQSGKSNSVSDLLNEANILRSLSAYFDDYIQKIPTVQKQKQEVIDRLEQLIEKLQPARQRKSVI